MGSLNLKYIFYVKWLCDILNHLYCYGAAQSTNNSSSTYCVVLYMLNNGGMGKVRNIVQSTTENSLYIVLHFTPAAKVTQNISIHCAPILEYCNVFDNIPWSISSKISYVL